MATEQAKARNLKNIFSPLITTLLSVEIIDAKAEVGSGWT